MKKAIVALSVLVLLSFAVLLFVNANGVTIKSKKACTEMSVKCPGAGECAGTACNKTAGDQSKCIEKGCDPANCKGMKCDQANCPKAKSGCPMQASAAAGCGKSCPMMTAGK